MTSSLKSLAEKFNEWLIEKAIPLSAEKGINPLNHASYEQFLPTGIIDYEADIRVRVQARQVYVFAMAAGYNWLEYGELTAKSMLDFTEKNAAHPEYAGGFSHLFDSDFNVIDTLFDLYNHAFFFLAYGGLYQASQCDSYLDKAEALYQILEQNFKSEHGGWYEGNYPAPYRRQNPHMHLFEAFMLLYSLSFQQKWLTRATAMFELFKSYFYDEKQGVLLEFFENNWAAHKSKRGDVIEPGHMLEWVWLLDRYSQLSGEDVTAYLAPLYKNALTKGMSDSGLIYKETKVNGLIVDGKKRCWAMTELIKASLVMLKRGDQTAEQVAADGLSNLMLFYSHKLNPQTGVDDLYIDEINEQDEVSIDKAPASSLYHFVTLAIELKRYLKTVG
ncbi:AGE family epimerase/isomerase [Catenovulum sp. 2E275]|uniref:AGE family epimerase/isomerase n=1 Tax=Catenovulum sp. 2E275 TaxID=2980497 RepID=UPI0021CF2067|nr:AGE family epimerase/isomerase [Catenovulum sp. 2E275]MCU4675920.1 AGE family epimerase/isomerase [Catenovulum sp. 2E275]